MLLPSHTRVFLALGHTDMRKAINGLSILVEEQLHQDPFSGHLFVFCNRRRHIVKILYWDRNGFCLWQKRLEKHFFRWPESEEQLMAIDQHQLGWLLQGLSLDQVRAHQTLDYTTMI